MSKEKIHYRLTAFRYEFLLVALLLLIFDKIFFPNNDIFLKYVWPINMIIISIASFGIFSEHNKSIQVIRRISGLISISMPFGFMFYSQEYWFVQFLTFFFIFYYCFINLKTDLSPA